MPITAKPFTIAEKIVRRIFAGSPSIYSKEDVNQMAEIDEYALYAMNNNLGYTTTGFVPTTPTFVQTATQLEFEVDYAGGGKLFAKKTVFDIPAFNYDRTGGAKITISTRSAGVRNFWLVAKRNVITFADDNVMSGVNGSGFPAPLPSSDAVTYSDERVEVTSGVDTAPTLGTDEEVIALLCQIAFKEDVSNAPVTGGSLAYLQINCPDITTILDRVFPSPNVASKTQGVIANLMKLADYAVNLLTNAAQKNGYTDISSSVTISSGFTAVIGYSPQAREYHDGTIIISTRLSFSGTKATGTSILTIPNGFYQNKIVPVLVNDGAGNNRSSEYIRVFPTGVEVFTAFGSPQTEVWIDLEFKKA